MKVQLLFIAFILTCTFLFAQRNIEITFNISDWQGNPKETGSIKIEKYKRNSKSNSQYTLGNYDIHTYQDKRKKGCVKLKLKNDFYKNTKVTITVFSFYDCHKTYTIENVLLKDGDEYNIPLVRDTVEYNNRTRTVGLYWWSDKNNLLGDLSEYFKEVDELTIFESDIEDEKLDRVILSFDIDSTCRIINRDLLNSEFDLKTDVLNQYLDKVEKKILKQKGTCNQIDSLFLPITFRGLNYSR